MTSPVQVNNGTLDEDERGSGQPRNGVQSCRKRPAPAHSDDAEVDRNSLTPFAAGASPHKRRRLDRPFRAGDLLLVQESYTRVFQTTLTPGAVLDTRYGTFRHDDLLGQPAGVRWSAARRPSSGRQQCGGFMHAVRLVPPLWGASVSHRTQIVHLPDASLIAFRLGLGAGDSVIEAGVGSAALAAQLAWAVGREGRVRSYEFHAARAQAAGDALAVAGLSHASVTLADVVTEGFKGAEDASADAVFLDLPAPEKVLAEAARVLRPGKIVCCFSPCVEQVLRTCEEARRGGLFHSIATVTAPVRTHETRPAGEGAGLGLLEAPRVRDRAAAEAVEKETAERHFGRVMRDRGRLASRPFSEMKGHTSFLTFATRVAGKPGGGSGERRDGAAANGESNGCVLQ